MQVRNLPKSNKNRRPGNSTATNKPKKHRKKMDIQLHCQEKGSGQPFLFLHGNGEDSRYFARQIGHFSNRYQVIAIDTRGHGQTPRGSAPFTIKQFALDLYGFMTERHLTESIILGFSDGANVAMEFALQHPEMVKALVLNGGNLNPDGVKRAVQEPIEAAYTLAKQTAGQSPEALKKAELLALMVNEPNIRPEELSRIICPTLVICGTDDMIKEEHTREIARNLPNAVLEFIEGDHFIAGKRPGPFNQAVDRFLETLSGACLHAKDAYMDLAIAEARQGIRNGDGGPFGSIIVKDGAIIGRGHNRVLSNHDATCHGEIAAIRDAGHATGNHDLSGAVLYTTGEPCPMCLAACKWANIRTVYYGCTIADNEKIGFRDKALDTMFGGREAFKDYLVEKDRDACLKLFEEYRNTTHETY